MSGSDAGILAVEVGFGADFFFGWTADLAAGLEAGFFAGFAVDLTAGFATGLAADFAADLAVGLGAGFFAGFAVDLAAGFDVDFTTALETGFTAGLTRFSSSAARLDEGFLVFSAGFLPPLTGLAPAAFFKLFPVFFLADAAP
jgi:hypothetical protein